MATTYQIVQKIEGAMIASETTDIHAWAEIRGIAITGYLNNSRNRAELQGQPKLSGFNGPMWNGGPIRYEDSAAYADLSGGFLD